MDSGTELVIETAGRPDPDGPPDPGARTVVRLVGVLDLTSAPMLMTRLCDELRRHGAVVADVCALRLTHSAAVHAFGDALGEAGEWPDVRLALAGADRTLLALLTSSRIAQRMLMCPDVPTAVSDMARRPDLVRGLWHFTVSTQAPSIARNHVRRVCERWAVDAEVREAAEIVVTELVTNAVEHAGSQSVVEVERRAGSFRMTVRDFETSTLPEAVLPPPTSSRGRGLAMVAAVSREWGVHHHADGKTVWAEMATG